MKKITVLHIFILGFVLRAAWLCYSLPIPTSDYLAYLNQAREIFHNHVYPSKYWLPGFPAFLSMWVWYDNYIWLEFINVLLNSLNIILVYYLAKNLWPGKEKAAALLFALNPQFIFFSAVLNSEGLAVFLFLLALLIAVVKGGRLGAVYSGLFMGFFCLTRGEGIFYIPLVGLMFYRKRLLHYLAPIAVLLGLWMWHNGGTLSTTSGVNLYYGHNPNIYGYHPLPDVDKNSVEVDKKYRDKAIKYILKEPWMIQKSVWQGIKGLYAPSDYGLQVSSRVDTAEGKLYREYPGKEYLSLASKIYWILLALFGIAGMMKMKDHAKLILSIVVVNYICYAVVFFGVARYRYIPEVFLCFAAAFILARGEECT